MWTWGKWVTFRLSNVFPAIRPCSQNFPILPYIYIYSLVFRTIFGKVCQKLSPPPTNLGLHGLFVFRKGERIPCIFLLYYCPKTFSLPVLHNCRNFYHQSTESALCILLYLCHVANIPWKELPIMIFTIYCNKALILHKLLWDCLLQSTLL